jgi:uroporphyrinogen III methyltransferase/synthase
MRTRGKRGRWQEGQWRPTASDLRKGIVYLVGAGPGDPDLITVKAKRLLEHCDVVVYDALIPYELVATLPAGVERRYVGKKAERHSLPQREINALLVELASQGNRVVRLKGGDPFVFGRGGEEAKYLSEHGVPFEIVPGITSGVAAPAFAGIPCTDRQEASHVTFVTGHKAVGKVSSSVPWDWVAQARNGTLVIYMGVSEIAKIVERLLEGGMPPDTPVAAVERGTFPTQRTVTTTIFVIGEIVTLHGKLDWFRRKPLSGVRVMVTQPGDQAAALYRALRERGAEVLAYPTISTTEDFHPDDWDALRRIAADERWLVFTNENGVRYFLKRWSTAVGDLRGLLAYRIAAVGAKTIQALQARGIVPDFVPTRATTSCLVEELAENPRMSDAVVVRVRGNLGDDYVETSMEQTGAEVFPLRVYRTIYAQWPAEVKEELFLYSPDVIMFTSGSAVEGFAANLEEGELRRLTEEATVVSIGPSTSKSIRSHGMTVGLESRRRTTRSIVEELLAHCRAVPLTENTDTPGR